MVENCSKIAVHLAVKVAAIGFQNAILMLDCPFIIIPIFSALFSIDSSQVSSAGKVCLATAKPIVWMVENCSKIAAHLAEKVAAIGFQNAILMLDCPCPAVKSERLAHHELRYEHI